jgi:hypothetical protein
VASPQTLERWHSVIDRYEASGQSLREFAEANDLNRKTLAWWRWELGRSARTPSTAFIELVVEEPGSGESSGTVVVELGDSGARALVGHGTDLPLLRRVAAALC